MQVTLPPDPSIGIMNKSAHNRVSVTPPSYIRRSSVSLALEKALLPTSKESTAAKLLMKMGWRSGQGIGPRLTWKQKKLRDAQAKSTRILTLNDLKLDPDEEDEEAQKHTYPRPDTPLTVVPRKDDAHGLGYNPGPSLNVALGNDRNSNPSGPRISGTLVDDSRLACIHVAPSWLWSGRIE